jgi:hypothetical protein
MAELTRINLRRTIRCIMAKGNGQKKSDGSHPGFEATLWATADKLRGNLDATLAEQFAESAKLEKSIRRNLEMVNKSL